MPGGQELVSTGPDHGAASQVEGINILHEGNLRILREAGLDFDTTSLEGLQGAQAALNHITRESGYTDPTLVAFNVAIRADNLHSALNAAVEQIQREEGPVIPSDSEESLNIGSFIVSMS